MLYIQIRTDVIGDMIKVAKRFLGRFIYKSTLKGEDASVAYNGYKI